MKTDTFFPTLSVIRTEFPSANIYNFWQIASEIDKKEIDDEKLAEAICLLQKEQSVPQCSAIPSSPQQVQFSTIFSLQKSALELIENGFIVVCDDINIWEQLLKLTIPMHINRAADWIYAIYKYTTQQTLTNILGVLRHSYLQQDNDLQKIGIEWEYRLRKELDKEEPYHPLYHYLLKTNSDKSFATIFSEITEKLPPELQEGIKPLAEYVNLLDGSSFCEEWFKKSLYLKEGSRQIRLGLHEALKFTPSQVVFCLQHSQIKPKLSASLIKKNQYNSLREQILKWQEENTLNILCYSHEPVFFHPLVENGCLQKHAEQKFFQEEERPIANPPVSSRPTTISASGFNLLMKDPYGFYARYILKLLPLERITSSSYAKEFGLAVHKTIEIHLKQGFESALQHVNTIILSKSEILWKNKLLRILNWVDGQIKDLKPTKIQSESDFHTVIGTTTLKARIDALLDVGGNKLVVNFKTGTPPSKAEVICGYAPQLAIEMFLIQRLNDNQSTQAEFWQLKGTQPPGSISSGIAIAKNILQAEIEKIIFHYFMTKAPFLTCPWPSKTSKCNEYKNLERLLK